jgi:hypothetical protein
LVNELQTFRRMQERGCGPLSVEVLCRKGSGSAAG